MHSSEDQHSHIICNLLSVPSTDHIPPTFDVHSYVSVDGTSSKIIQLDGKDFLVPEILESALRHLRLSGENRHLWIHSICLEEPHPSDPKVVMNENADIHSAAREIIVWLGGNAVRFRIAFSAVKMLPALMPSEILAEKSQRLDELLSLPSFATALSSSQPLFNLPWWHWERIGALVHLEFLPRHRFVVAQIIWTGISFRFSSTRSDMRSQGFAQTILPSSTRFCSKFPAKFPKSFGNPSMTHSKVICRTARILSAATTLCLHIRKMCFTGCQKHQKIPRQDGCSPALAFGSVIDTGTDVFGKWSVIAKPI